MTIILLCTLLAAPEPEPHHRRETAVTELVIVGALIGVMAYDVYAGYSENPDDTVSQVIGRGAKKHPMIPFAAGLLMGHLFWRW